MEKRGRPGLNDHVMGMRHGPHCSSPSESQGQATVKRRGTGVPACLLVMGHVAIRMYITVSQ